MYKFSTVGLFGGIAEMMRSQGEEVWKMQPGDSTLLWVPMRGVGSTLLSWIMLAEGQQLVMVEPKTPGMSSAEDWGPLFDKYSPRFHLLFGAAMQQLLATFPGRTFPSVTEVQYGGSCFPPSLVLKSMEQFPNATFKQGYAQTECLPISELSAEVRALTSPYTRRLDTATPLGPTPLRSPAHVYIRCTTKQRQVTKRRSDS